ncbi:hypothetical protein F2P81_025190 [Scophthalmus maximus]|uniref:Uncharacterized protein n=1 Tax=Scophthalmus maximus TaxID=52904 RepID=A0A6A4RVN0_SCOMX|nr:hypothetical protein F2P81_025190 [Scophthalmus maximus]
MDDRTDTLMSEAKVRTTEEEEKTKKRKEKKQQQRVMVSLFNPWTRSSWRRLVSPFLFFTQRHDSFG